MAKFFKKFFIKTLSTKPGFNKQKNSHLSAQAAKIKITSDLNKNVTILREILGGNNDIKYRKFLLGFAEKIEVAAFYADGMVNKSTLNNDILKPLMLESKIAGIKLSGNNLLEIIKERVLTSADIKETNLISDLVDDILYGSVVLIIDSQITALSIDVKEWDTRSITEPESEVLVRGPREGFNENLRTNTTLLRRKLRNPDLVMENITIGRMTHTNITITYIKGLADPQIINELKVRLSRIDIDGVLDSNYIEEYIEDNPYSPFPQVLHTERPDRVAASLLEGRVAILTDGTPFALVVPITLPALMQSPEDYYERYFLGSAIRLLRYFAFAVSLLLPSLYIAITTFHQEMIPTRLLITLVSTREGVPFPAIIEAMLMELTFEALREAGIRLPRAVGQAVSIVGALVIGQAAVQAGIVAPMMVIVVALTGIASFVNPAFNVAVTMRFLRFPMMLFAATLGLFGVMTGILLILIHLACLRSFGIPYLEPFAPFLPEDIKDTIIRAPFWAMDLRPKEHGRLNMRRQAKGLKPAPPKPGGKGDDNN